MPGGDRTGPMGAGPRSGRTAGYCAGYGMPGFANRFGGRGLGRGGGFNLGGGFGRGWRNRFFATGVPGRASGGGRRLGLGYGYPPSYSNQDFHQEDEQSFLTEQAEYFKSAIEDINRRLDELQPKREGEK